MRNFKAWNLPIVSQNDYIWRIGLKLNISPFTSNNSILLSTHFNPKVFINIVLIYINCDHLFLQEQAGTWSSTLLDKKNVAGEMSLAEC